METGERDSSSFLCSCDNRCTVENPARKCWQQVQRYRQVEAFPPRLILSPSSLPVCKSDQPRHRNHRFQQCKPECWVVLTVLGSVSIPFYSACTVSSATAKNLVGGTGIELGNGARLLPEVLAHHIYTSHAQLQHTVPGNGRRGKELVKGSKTLLKMWNNFCTMSG